MEDIQVGIVYRGWVAESWHRGRIVVTNPDGSIRLALGSTSDPTLPRSALKPFQVIAMMESGLDLDGKLLALAGASHWGEPIHVAAATEILAGVGLSPLHLRNTVDLPGDEAARAAWQAEGRGKESLAHNCSGKHSAMLRTCVRAGWESESYRDPQHPLQLKIREVIDRYCGVLMDPVVDGCTAPAFATTLDGLARGFGRLASSEDGAAKAIADAYRNFPEYVSGVADPCVALQRSVPGMVLKTGAEAILAAGLPDGVGIAVKISDGMGRGSRDVMAAILRYLGYKPEVTAPEIVLAPELEEALGGLQG